MRRCVSKFFSRAAAALIAMCALHATARAAESASVIFPGAASFPEQKLRSALSEQLGEIDTQGQFTGKVKYLLRFR